LTPNSASPAAAGKEDGMKKPKNKTAPSAPARSALHEQIRGRNRRFEDSRDKRSKDKLRKELRAY